ncbi:MAG: hypothetical protein ACO1QS_12610 [Verrucomicrobiota bacterium]
MQPAPPVENKPGFAQHFGKAFLVLAIVLGLMFRTFAVLPFLVILSLTFAGVLYVRDWRPPPEASPVKVLLLRVFFGVGIVVAALAVIMGGCIMILADSF